MEKPNSAEAVITEMAEIPKNELESKVDLMVADVTDK